MPKCLRFVYAHTAPKSIIGVLPLLRHFRSKGNVLEFALNSNKFIKGAAFHNSGHVVFEDSNIVDDLLLQTPLSVDGQFVNLNRDQYAWSYEFQRRPVKFITKFRDERSLKVEQLALDMKGFYLAKESTEVHASDVQPGRQDPYPSAVSADDQSVVEEIESHEVKQSGSKKVDTQEEAPDEDAPQQLQRVQEM